MRGLTGFSGIILVCAAMAGPAFASDEAANKGYLVAEQKCTPCHVSVKHDVDTKYTIAPRFEELAQTTPAALRARLNAKHVMMPQFPELNARDVDHISAYLKSLAKKK